MVATEWQKRFNEAFIHYNNNRVAEALQTLNSIENVTPANKKGVFYKLRAYILIKQQDLKGALLNYNMAYSAGERSAELFYNRGTLLQNLGAGKQAINDMSEAIKLKHPQLAWVYLVRSRGFFGQKQLDKALSDINRAITLGLKTAEAYQLRADILLVAKHARESITDYTTAIALDSKQTSSYYNRAAALSSLNEWDSAISDLTSFLALTPQPDIYLARGGLFIRLRRYAEALQDLNTFIGTPFFKSFVSSPQAAIELQAYCLRAIANFYTNNREQSLTDCEACLQRNIYNEVLPTEKPAKIYFPPIISNIGIYDIQSKLQRDSARTVAYLNHVRYLARDTNLYAQDIARLTPFAAYTVQEFPAHLQLYPRDSKDSACVPVRGSIRLTGFDSVYVRIMKNGQPFARIAAPLRYVGMNSSFDFTPSIHAELSEYTFQLGIKSTKLDTLLLQRDSIVCGDVFAITGQSNAICGSGTTLRNEFCRTFQHTYLDAWAVSSALYDAGKHLVGGFGLNLQYRIVRESGIPVLLLNGAQTGTFIERHLPDSSNRNNSITLYGSLLTNAVRANVQAAIKGLIWYQGEWNSDINYAANFKTLYTAWHQDFPKLQRIYVMQIRPHGVGENHAVLREIQRRFPKTFPDVRAFPTVGVAGHNGSHFNAEGYARLAELFTPMILRDFYGKQDIVGGVDAPNIVRVRWGNGDHSELLLEFTPSGGNLILSEPVQIGAKLWKVADAISLDGRFGEVAEVDCLANTLRVRLKSPSKARFVGYVPEKLYPQAEGVLIYQGPWLTNTRGV